MEEHKHCINCQKIIGLDADLCEVCINEVPKLERKSNQIQSIKQMEKY